MTFENRSDEDGRRADESESKLDWVEQFWEEKQDERRSETKEGRDLRRQKGRGGKMSRVEEREELEHRKEKREKVTVVRYCLRSHRSGSEGFSNRGCLCSSRQNMPSSVPIFKLVKNIERPQINTSPELLNSTAESRNSISLQVTTSIWRRLSDRLTAGVFWGRWQLGPHIGSVSGESDLNRSTVNRPRLKGTE